MVPVLIRTARAASSIFSKKPILAKIGLVDGVMDSPTWSRGWMSFSRSSAR
jgi:hypothetical protein